MCVCVKEKKFGNFRWSKQMFFGRWNVRFTAKMHIWIDGKIHGSMKMIHGQDKPKQMERRKKDKLTTCDKWREIIIKKTHKFPKCCKLSENNPFYLCFASNFFLLTLLVLLLCTVKLKIYVLSVAKCVECLMYALLIKKLQCIFASRFAKGETKSFDTSMSVFF